MNDDLAQLRERTRQNRAALSDELARDEAKTTTAAAAVTRTPVAGDRVLDLVSGQEGIVEMADGIMQINGPAVAVRLPSGGVLIRPRSQLVVRPTPPAAE